MRVVCISDTHCQHQSVKVPDGDILIHAGDLTDMGSVDELRPAIQWLARQPHGHKVFIAGNHDWVFESDALVARALVPAGVHYLEDSGCTIAGLKFWGSPVQPWFMSLAFNRERGDDIGRHWAMIPPDTDVLITHGPPYGKLDRIGNTERGGCEMLRRRLLEIRPRLHVFGHLHGGYGTDTLGSTILVNASICNDCGYAANEPLVIDL